MDFHVSMVFCRTNNSISLLGIHSPSGTDFARQHAPLQPNADRVCFHHFSVVCQRDTQHQMFTFSSSCFYYKDFNGQLRRLFHGTKHIETQIAFRVSVHQSLPILSLQNGTNEKDLYSKMMENKPHRISEYVEDGTYIVGAFHNRTITMEEEGAICNIVWRYI